MLAIVIDGPKGEPIFEIMMLRKSEKLKNKSMHFFWVKGG